ncbi:hypothetical protein HMPREF0294_0577 [Corynebacterium glucuronolyticum ATCC 51867]|nr:hypothetical protein HMPREF0294_0577 [Corynebacterium glucuronolyticum ATCC 51867]
MAIRICPAPAGMSPRRLLVVVEHMDLPRTCGDEPVHRGLGL